LQKLDSHNFLKKKKYPLYLRPTLPAPGPGDFYGDDTREETTQKLMVGKDRSAQITVLARK